MFFVRLAFAVVNLREFAARHTPRLGGIVVIQKRPGNKRNDRYERVRVVRRWPAHLKIQRAQIWTIF